MQAKYLIPFLLALVFVVLYLFIPEEKPPVPVKECEITPASLPQGTVGQDYSATLAAKCDPIPLKWSAPPGDLPPGLSLSEDGKISGKPQAAAAGRTFSFEVTVTNSATPPQSAKKRFQITIGDGRCTITPSALPNGTEDRPYPPQTLRTINCTAPLTWSVSAGALPPGLRLNAQTGVIDGTPTQAQANPFNFTVRVTDSASPARSDTQDFQITIRDVILPCTITPAQLPNGTEDQSYPPQTLRTTNCTAPLTWSVSAGTLPPGLRLNAQTGVIDGTPTQGQANPFNFTVRVTDSASPARSDTEDFRITIGPGCRTHSVSMNNFLFIPRTLTIGVCDTVTWTHDQQGIPHTVTSDNGVFENGTVANPMTFGQTFSHTFANPGTFPYHCRIHGAPGGGGMSGTITVSP